LEVDVLDVLDVLDGWSAVGLVGGGEGGVAEPAFVLEDFPPMLEWRESGERMREKHVSAGPSTLF
jgi:hypothetical protein